MSEFSSEPDVASKGTGPSGDPPQDDGDTHGEPDDDVRAAFGVDESAGEHESFWHRITHPFEDR